MPGTQHARLPLTLQHHQQPSCLAGILNAELGQLPAGTLPLQLGTRQGGYVDEKDLHFGVLAVNDNAQAVRIKAGVFFTEIVINCGCGNDPMEIPAYREIIITINKVTAEACFEVRTDLA